MKKIFAVVLLACCIFLTACSDIKPYQKGIPLISKELEVAKKGYYTTARSFLDPKLQEAYDLLDQEIYHIQTSVKVTGISPEEIKKLVEYYKADNPQVFWLSGDYGYEYNIFTKSISGISLNYFYTDENGNDITYTGEMIEQMNLQIEAEAALILSSITPEMSEYDKVKYLHDYLARNVVYDDTAAFQHNLYGALVEKRAVCDGYTYAMMYLLSQLGMESRIAYGVSVDGVSHAWNIVKIEGEYYHLDITWDIPPTEIPMILYTNFNIDDETAKQRRVILSPAEGTTSEEFDYYVPIPACTATQYNYFYYNQLLIQGYSNGGVDHFLDILEHAVENRITEVQVLFETATDFQAFMNDVTSGTNPKFQRFPYSNGSWKINVATSEVENLAMFQFQYY